MSAIDTISQTSKVIHDTIYVRSVDVVNISKDVHSFYQESWSNLLWVLGVAFAVIGILVPIVVQLLQNSNNKKIVNMQMKVLEDKISDLKSQVVKQNESLLEQNKSYAESLTSAQEEMKSATDTLIAERMLSFNGEIDNTKEEMNAIILVLKGDIHFESARYYFHGNKPISASQNAILALEFIVGAIQKQPNRPKSNYLQNIEKVLSLLSRCEHSHFITSTENDNLDENYLTKFNVSASRVIGYYEGYNSIYKNIDKARKNIEYWTSRGY